MASFLLQFMLVCTELVFINCGFVRRQWTEAFQNSAIVSFSPKKESGVCVCTQAHALNLCSQNSANHGGVLNSFIRFYVVSVRVASLIVPNSLERKAWLALFHRKGKGEWNDLSWKLSWYLTNSVLFQCLDTFDVISGYGKDQASETKKYFMKRILHTKLWNKGNRIFSIEGCWCQWI